MRLRFEPKVLGLLEGTIDIHIHSAPDIVPRILSDIDLARQCKEMGMRAILVKSHFVQTADRALLASEEASFPVFGGVAMNLTMGGVNPHAVEYCLKVGGKMVWLPTVHAREFLAHRSHVASLAATLDGVLQGVEVLNPDGSVREEMYRVFDLIARHDATLATGHVSKQEAKAVVREAARQGVKKIVVTHPMASFVSYSLEDMKEMLDLGATYFEHVYNDVTHNVAHPIRTRDLVEAIEAIGPEHSIMSTDSGQWQNPVPVQQMCIYIKEMLDLGLSERAIRTMVSDNPARIVGF
ncbi:MAG: DUF6282 family protein [Sphingomonadaceae bacterium]